MSDGKIDLVKRAFKACDDGDQDELRKVFAYDNSVQIRGAFCLDDDNAYPKGKTDIGYGGHEVQADGSVKSEFRWRPAAGGEYNATVTNTVSGGKITSSAVKWTDRPYNGDTDGAPPWYADKYGWWGWPFGRRRR